MNKSITCESRLCTVPFTNGTFLGKVEMGSFVVGIAPCHGAWLSDRISSNKYIYRVDSDINKSFNSSVYKYIRGGILDGSYEWCNKSKCPLLKNHLDGVVLFDKINDVHTLTDDTRNKIISGDVDSYSISSITDSMIKDCNLTCPSCRSGIIKTDKVYIDVAEGVFKSSLETVTKLTFSGTGEFMTIPYLRKFITTFSSDEYPNIKFISLLSNATLLSEAVLDSFSDDFWKIDKDILVSIDAGSKEVYDVVRPGYGFGVVINNIKSIHSKIQSSGVGIIRLAFVLQENNFTDLTQFIQLSHELCVNCVCITSIEPWNDVKTHCISSDVTNKEHRLYDDFVMSFNSAMSLADEIGVVVIHNINIEDK